MEVAEHTAARKAIWEAERTAPACEQPSLELEAAECEVIEPTAEGTGGKTLPTSLSDGRKAGPQHQHGFAADTAAKTGRSKRAINLAIARAANIAPDVLDAVRGTALDTGASLDRLAKMEPEEQREVVAER